MTALLDRDDSLLLLIDAQDGFYGPERADVDRAAFAQALERMAWLAGAAAALSVPAVVTEEDAAGNGPTAPEIAGRLPEGTPVLDKPVFGAGDNPPILAAVEATGRGTVALAGLETDVCVAHSALSLLSRGFRVVAVNDALFSPGRAHHNGLERLRRAGAEELSAKELFYDWTRTLAAARDFTAAHPELADPPGFSL
jgi:nicotinamidase-related amidase